MKKLAIAVGLFFVLVMGLGSSLAAAANPGQDGSSPAAVIADLKWSKGGGGLSL